MVPLNMKIIAEKRDAYLLRLSERANKNVNAPSKKTSKSISQPKSTSELNKRNGQTKGQKISDCGFPINGVPENT
jgi:hypothetical protein